MDNRVSSGLFPTIDTMPVGHLGRLLDVGASRACLLAETLGWAVTRGIPLPEALRTLPFYCRFRPDALDLLTRLAWAFTPTCYWLFVPWLNDLRWTRRINQVIEDLEKGLALGPSLQGRLGRFVPEFYLQGLMRAEIDGRLETALPILAEQMAYPLSISRRRFMASLTALVETVTLIGIVSFLIIFIVPRFQEICRDLGVTFWFPGISPGYAGFAGLLLLGISLWAAGLLCLPRMGRWGYRLSHRIPWVTPTRRRFLVLDLARALCAGLRQDEDLITAATWAQECTPSYWMKDRLERFLVALRAGEPWLDAWDQAGIGGPFDRWALRNADAREDPASGFSLIAEWTHQQIEIHAGRLERYLAPLVTILIGACIGAVGVAFFQAMTTVLQSIL